MIFLMVPEWESGSLERRMQLWKLSESATVAYICAAPLIPMERHGNGNHRQPHSGPRRGIEHLVQADAATARRPRQSDAHPDAHDGTLWSGVAGQHGEPTRRAGFGTGILQACARHQGGQLRQIFRRAEAYL